MLDKKVLYLLLVTSLSASRAWQNSGSGVFEIQRLEILRSKAVDPLLAELPCIRMGLHLDCSTVLQNSFMFLPCPALLIASAAHSGHLPFCLLSCLRQSWWVPATCPNCCSEIQPGNSQPQSCASKCCALRELGICLFVSGWV